MTLKRVFTDRTPDLTPKNDLPSAASYVFSLLQTFHNFLVARAEQQDFASVFYHIKFRLN